MPEEPEQDVVAEYLSLLLKAPFEASEVPDSRTGVKGKAKWFVWCPDLAYLGKVGHIKYIWKDRDDYVWLESSEIGDTIGLIEEEHGEEGARALMKMDLSKFGEQEVRESFDRRFPLAAKRFDVWNDILNQVSKNHGVHLQLRFDGARDIVIFTIGARNEPGKDEFVRMKLAIEALRDAYKSLLKTKTSP